jgi:vacuolar protein sorting-associated protein 13A/C
LPSLLFYYQETFSSTERPVLDVHQRRSYYVVPQNKLGQDIYVRTTENRGSLVTLLPSGDDRSIKVPALRDLSDSHLNGRSVKPYRLMITAILADAEVALLLCTKLRILLPACAFSLWKWRSTL